MKRKLTIRLTSGQAVDNAGFAGTVNKARRRRWSLSALAAVLMLAISPQITSAQNVEKRDTIPTHKLDSIGADKGEKVVEIESYAARFNPQKAMLYSAILPGAGQIYNKAAWKVPIIWGGFIALGYYGIKYNQLYYVHYKDLLYQLLNEPSPLVIIDKDGSTAGGNRFLNGRLVPHSVNIGIETLRQRVNRYQRDRDFAVMLTAMWYLLQMVEAHVDAHLKEFKVNPQLKVMIEPAMDSNYFTGRTSGLSLKLRF